LGLPDIDGFQVLKKIRESSDLPVLVLTVRSDEIDIVKGLEWGADEYLTKPFKQMELLARIRSIMRRRRKSESDLCISCGPFRLDCTKDIIYYHNNEIKLTNTETVILYKLMLNAGSVVSHSSLIQEVWDNADIGAAEAIRVYIRHLRLKIEPIPNKPQFIITRTGGYLFQKF
jgi:two-component system KDP operon response regulator KdpE